MWKESVGVVVLSLSVFLAAFEPASWRDRECGRGNRELLVFDPVPNHLGQWEVVHESRVWKHGPLGFSSHGWVVPMVTARAHGWRGRRFGRRRWSDAGMYIRFVGGEGLFLGSCSSSERPRVQAWKKLCAVGFWYCKSLFKVWLCVCVVTYTIFLEDERSYLDLQ